MNPDGAPGLRAFVAAYQKQFGLGAALRPQPGQLRRRQGHPRGPRERQVDRQGQDPRSRAGLQEAAPAALPPAGASQFDENGSEHSRPRLNLMQWQQGKLETVYPGGSGQRQAHRRATEPPAVRPPTTRARGPRPRVQGLRMSLLLQLRGQRPAARRRLRDHQHRSDADLRRRARGQLRARRVPDGRACTWPGFSASQLGLHPYAVRAPIVVVLPVRASAQSMQRYVIQPLLSADAHIQIFATVGVSTALLNLALLVFGADIRKVDVRVRHRRTSASAPIDLRQRAADHFRGGDRGGLGVHCLPDSAPIPAAPSARWRRTARRPR